MSDKCLICKVNPAAGLNTVCIGCKPIQSICCTSAEDGVKYGIPGASLETLLKARKYEKGHGCRSTVIKAIDRAIKIAERGPDNANKTGCGYFEHLGTAYVAPKFPLPLGQLCNSKECKINCGRKSS